MTGLFGTTPMLGLPVIESIRVPENEIFLLGGQVLVRDLWTLRWYLFLAEQRQLARGHLRAVVAEAEYRLGLSEIHQEGPA